MCVYVCTPLSTEEYFLCIMVTRAYILVETSGEEVTEGRRESN